LELERANPYHNSLVWVSVQTLNKKDLTWEN